MRRFLAAVCLVALSVGVISSAGTAGPVVPGDVTAKPAKVSFGGVKLTTFKSVSVTLKNNTSATEYFDRVYAPAELGYSIGDCGSISAGGTCTFEMTIWKATVGKVSVDFQMNYSPTGALPYYALIIPVSASVH